MPKAPKKSSKSPTSAKPSKESPSAPIQKEIEHLNVVNTIEFEIPNDKPIPAVLSIYNVPTTLIFFFHGSGGDMNSSNLRELSEKIVTDSNGSIAVLRVTTKPPNLGWRVKVAKKVLEFTQDKSSPQAQHFASIKKWVVMGRSMGSRVAAKLAIESDIPSAAILMVFPFENPDQKSTKDDEREGLVLKLAEKKVPMLFIAGDNDHFCPIPKLKSILSQIQSKDYHIFENLGHSLTASPDRTREIESIISSKVIHFIK